MTHNADTLLVVSRTFDAPRALVYAAWTDPDRLRHWWSPECDADVRPGGSWRARVVGPDGASSWSHGTYRELTPPEKVAYTFAWDATDTIETTVTVLLEDDGSGTRLTARQGPFLTVQDRDDHASGWNTALDELAAYLAAAGAA